MNNEIIYYIALGFCILMLFLFEILWSCERTKRREEERLYKETVAELERRVSSCKEREEALLDEKYLAETKLFCESDKNKNLEALLSHFERENEKLRELERMSDIENSVLWNICMRSSDGKKELVSGEGESRAKRTKRCARRKYRN